MPKRDGDCDFWSVRSLVSESEKLALRRRKLCDRFFLDLECFGLVVEEINRLLLRDDVADGSVSKHQDLPCLVPTCVCLHSGECRCDVRVLEESERAGLSSFIVHAVDLGHLDDLEAFEIFADQFFDFGFCGHNYLLCLG